MLFLKFILHGPYFLEFRHIVHSVLVLVCKNPIESLSKFKTYIKGANLCFFGRFKKPVDKTSLFSGNFPSFLINRC